MRNIVASCCVAVSLVAGATAFAQTGHGTPMPGWSCRMLNLTEAQSMDFSIHIPVRAEPSEASPPVGYASETVAVKTSAPQVNGFVQAMFPTGRTVWIAAKSLKPWHAAANPSAKCVPVTKANGKPGFAYPQ
jgi:hypothetical protein